MSAFCRLCFFAPRPLTYNYTQIQGKRVKLCAGVPRSSQQRHRPAQGNSAERSTERDDRGLSARSVIFGLGVSEEQVATFPFYLPPSNYPI
jgi:hypothetical protein